LSASRVIGAAESSSSPVEFIDSEYLVETWQTEQGLPDNFVNDIAQTPDGYVWIATFNGLARFNGVEFVNFDSANTPEFSSDGISDFYLDRSGRMWIKGEHGQLSLYAQGRFTSFASQLPKAGINRVAEDHEGNIWTGSSWDGTNSFEFVDGSFKLANSSNTLFERFGTDIDREGYGFGIRSNVLFSANPTSRLTVVPGIIPGHGLRLTTSSDGGTWIIADRIQKYHPPTQRQGAASPGYFEDFGPIPVATDLFERYREDRKGNLWVGTGVGELWRIGTNHTFKRFKFRNSTTVELGRGMFEDAEGNLWIGNGGDGVVRLRPRTLQNFDSRDGLASDVVRSVTEDKDRNVWLATVNSVDWFRSSAGASIPRNERPRAQARGLPVVLPWSIYGSHDGAVWIGTFGEGLLRVRGNETTWFKESENGRDPVINGIFEDRQGQIFAETPRGLFGVNGGSLVKQDLPTGLPATSVEAMVETKSGQVYLALKSAGLLRKSKSGWERFTTAEGLPDNQIMALYADRDDRVWIGTHSRGLSRFENGRFFNFVQTRVELPHLINCILEDDEGCLWFGSTEGLFRAERRKLNELADRAGNSTDMDAVSRATIGWADPLKVTHYDRSDGMGSSQCTGEACKAHDGKLWFATMNGVTVVDPQSLPFNRQPPPVVVEAVLIDDVLRPTVESASVPREGKSLQMSVTVPPGVHRLEIRYAGLSFTDPEGVRFRYRLSGFEKDWVNAGARRAAYYTKIPPGTYQFQVLACNNDGVWNEIGASIGVRVEPLFWQTNWFRVVAVLVVVGFGIALYELRVQGLKRQQALQANFSRKLIESQENERKRIAAELHDSLGQSLLVVKNYAAMALKEPKLPEKAHKQLLEISDSASASIEEVRSIARALRPYQLDRFGLTKTLEDAAELAAQTGHLEIATAVDNIDGLFSPDAEISIYRMVQEWLNNVVKHSRAAHARLLVRKEAGIMRMILEDDGVGFAFDLVVKQPGAGFGLANLGERAHLLGGNLKIETAPGKGTRLLADIPFNK
jgi:signal transduction histidine kinase/ligand-binding sensor domain-containing protein